MANEDELERRIRRLEALFSAMLMSDGDLSSKSYERLIERLLHRPKEPDMFYDELYFLLRENPFRTRDRMGERMDALSDSQTKLQGELHNYLVAQSMGVDPNLIPLHRFVSVQVYLPKDDAETVTKLSDAIRQLLDAFDFEIADDFPPELSSWFKKWFAKTKDVATQPEVADRLKKIERAIELKQLQETQASIDEKQAKATRDIMAALENTPDAVCLVGSILTVKISGNTPRAYVRSLTPEEMIFLSNNQHLLKSPETILEALASNAQQCEPTTFDTTGLMNDDPLRPRLGHDPTDGG
ncbi:hypothetical protein Poly24_54890 [Rosistilla carotiformis]|uniref:Uncharacterized protein n=1 Tax=Rosistilla carotiformis TaxID=2528017 RepID=A0A518K1V3_9BACT|nr:hypothetical protein [Rosistilla carotiformis]QDV71749.1 hypothetical protein Poly24_54890 [Rosistilla carotiformis]